MGGDFAPQSAVVGALSALQEKSDLKISFFGQQTAIQNELCQHDYPTERVQIINTNEVVLMSDSATKVIKRKPDSSLVKGIRAHQSGDVDGFVSMGNTGAVLSSAILILKRIENVKRPTIGAFLPNTQLGCLLLDVGASLEVLPHHLFQFALMGQIYYSHMLDVENPKVGLLNVGEEDGKGMQSLIKAQELLSELPNYIGNVEGKDILHGNVDVVVCDGFVGNVILKFAGSIYPFIKVKTIKHVGKNLLSMFGMTMLRKPLKKIEREMDYQEYGGVPLLGVNGNVVIGHGKSTPRAFMNAILNARKMVIENINGIIQEKLSRFLIPLEKTT